MVPEEPDRTEDNFISTQQMSGTGNYEWLPETDEGNSAWSANDTGDDDDDEYMDDSEYYDYIYESSVYSYKPTFKCKEHHLVDSCYVPHCSEYCPDIRRFGVRLVSRQELHEILYPGAKRVCKQVCDVN